MSSSEAQVGRLGRDGIAEVDASDLLEDILALPEHLRDALWKAQSAELGTWDSAGGMIVAGMGGSAVGGALARAALGDTASRPLLSSRAYGLPAWTTPDTTVLCASYSGDTEETLAAYEAAGALGARRVAATTGGELAQLARADGVPVIPLAGGLQPRAAVGYMLVAALEVAASCGVGPRMNSAIDVAADNLEKRVVDWGPDAAADSLAKRIAAGIAGSVATVVGAGITEPIAYRWKTQLNEIAKVPAFSHELPELDHNEICGWEGAPELGRFSVVFLDDPDLHPRVRERVALTEELVGEHACATFRVETEGAHPVERVLSLVLLGDLVALYVAVLRGVDPTPVAAIDKLKARLAQRA